MQIFVLGLNHHLAPVELREKFAIAADRYAEFLAEAARLPYLQETLLLSTCNRVEIYGVSSHPHLARQQLTNLLEQFQGMPGQWSENQSYFLQSEAAIEHGFQVASSLDSMIVGEPQILGQVKDAYRIASEAGTTGVCLNKFFHRAFNVAKRIRTETGIAQHPVSIAYTAVLLSKQIFGELAGKKALVLGAGKMSEGAIRHFQSQGISQLYIANRSPEKAEQIANLVGGETVPFDSFHKWLVDADIVLSSTGAAQYLVSPEMVQEAIRHRQGRPMFFIDIAVPRNVAPGVNQLPNVYLYDIDDLGAVVEANKHERCKEADKARAILVKEAEEFHKLLLNLKVVPTISSLTRKFDQICRRELEKTFQKMPELSPEGREALERMAYAIANKILHDPMIALKEEDSERSQSDYANTLRKMFRLDEV